MLDHLKKATYAMAYELLQSSEKVKEGSQNIKDRSIIGLLSEYQLCLHPLVADNAYQSKDKLQMRLLSWYWRKLFHRYAHSSADP